jgi:hypothetical protein
MSIYIYRLLKRENNWNSWKIASCPSFEKSPSEIVSGGIKGMGGYMKMFHTYI